MGGVAPLLSCELGTEGAADLARRRLDFLTAVSEVIASSLDLRPMLAEVADLLVPRLADWCSIHVIGDDGSMERVVVRHADPSKVELAAELMTRQRINVQGDHPVGDAIRSGQPQLVPRIARDFIQRTANDDRDVELYEALGASSSVAAPLVARGRTLGIISLTLGHSGREYSEADLILIDLVARRCAVAVDNARLYEATQIALKAKDESLALLDALFSTAPVGLAFVDDQLRFVRVNAHMAEMNGVAIADHIGRKVRDVLPALGDLVEDSYRSVLATGQPIVEQEITGETPADPGIVRHWHTTYYPIARADGVRFGVGVIVREVTEEKLARDELRHRARQQAAVAELGERALRTSDIHELMEDALAVVRRALEVDFAAVLELNREGNVLEIVAAAGWPVDRKGATEPATAESQAGYTLVRNRPVIVRDTSAEHRFHLPPEAIEHGVASTISVVVRGGGEGVGVMGAASLRRRDFAEYDVDFFEAVANVVGAAWARAEAEADLRAERERLGLALDAGRMGTWHWDMASGVLAWSETMEAIFGLSSGAFEGTLDHWIDRVAPEDRDAVLTSFGNALGRTTDDVIEQRVVRPDGSVRCVEAIARVLRDDRGEPIGMIGVATDVTDRKEAEDERARLFEAERQARAAAEATQDTLEFLASASALLAESLDYRSTLARVARLAVPRLADWCSVEVPDDAHHDVEFVVAHVEPEKVELAHELRRRYPADPRATRGVPNVMRTGRSELLPVISDEDLRTLARDEEHLAALQGMGMRSAMIVPLIARGRTIGAVSFLSETEGREYGDDDLRLVEELARRAAIAIDNARLYRDRSHVARTLQESLLPPRLPKIPGIEIAARYRFAGEGNEIGGDFYDLFETADGAWAIVMGDACGKGPEAAALTGLARHSVRAAAVRERTPSRVLALLNESILGQVTDNRFLTAAYARLEPGEGAARMIIACGGHPPAMVVRASGRVDATTATGTLVGILPEAEFTDERIDLSAGDAVVLYTDGVVEARRGDEIFGEERLRDLLATCTHYDARGIANTVRQAVGDFQPGVPHDDMAILVLRVRDAASD